MIEPCRLTLLALLTMTAVPCTRAQAIGAEERHVEDQLKSRIFNNTRAIRVFLPPSYHDPAQSERRYPVFYFTDGLAAWDAWGVPEVAETLWRGGEIRELIFVGIDNGGSTVETANPVVDRASEYLPYEDQTWTEAPIPEPRGDKFPAFLFDEVLPLIDSAYRTKKEGENTGLAGDSFAATAALYTALKHPDRIGMLLLETPALHVGNRQPLRDSSTAAAWPPMVYIGVGTAEGDTPEIQGRMLSTVQELYATIRRRSPATKTKLLVVEGGIHWFSAWKERLPEALRFLIGVKD